MKLLIVYACALFVAISGVTIVRAIDNVPTSHNNVSTIHRFIYPDVTAISGQGRISHTDVDGFPAVKAQRLCDKRNHKSILVLVTDGNTGSQGIAFQYDGGKC